MTSDILLQAPLHAAVASAGYRVVRWAAAREVLQARVAKGRVAGELGEFLRRWLPAGVPGFTADAFVLVFDLVPEGLCLQGGDPALVAAAHERALLHLPALRSFWRNELRLEHFEALRRIVPPAWFMDDAKLPPGAVIHGLGITGFEQLDMAGHDEWEVRDGALSRIQPASTRICSRYGRDERGRVVLRSLEAAS